MKKFITIILAFLLLFLTACQMETKTPAEAYLDNHSEQEIVDYFEQVIYTYENFNNPMELSSEALLNFIIYNSVLDLEQWFDESSFSYQVPMEKLYTVFDKYFGEYNFGPQNCYDGQYDTQNDVLIISAIGGGVGSTALAFISADVIDDNHIKVFLNMYSCDDEPDLNNDNVYITAKIIGDEAQFTSYYCPYNK